MQRRSHGNQSDPPMIKDEEMLEAVRKKEMKEDAREPNGEDDLEKENDESENNKTHLGENDGTYRLITAT